MWFSQSDRNIGCESTDCSISQVEEYPIVVSKKVFDQSISKGESDRSVKIKGLPLEPGKPEVDGVSFLYQL